MTFWTNSGFEPKRAFRFKVSIGGIDPFYVKSVTKPTFTVEEGEHKFLNRSYYFPGHVTWNPVTVTMVDDINGNVMTRLSSIVGNSNYADIVGDQMNSNTPYRTIQKQGFSKNTVDGTIAQINPLAPVGADPLDQSNGGQGSFIRIEQIDSTGAIVVEQTILWNGWIKSITPSELSYDSEDLSTYEVEIRYDWAEILGQGNLK